MKIILIIVLFVLVAAGGGALIYRSVFAGPPQIPQTQPSGSLWDFQVRTLAGEPAPLGAYRGQVALVVNVASKCGFTPQYKGLEAIYERFRGDGFVVLGFPSNDFRQQEPGTPSEIQEFCRLNYGVTFPLLAKVRVKGDDKAAVFKFLTAGGVQEPTWNFTKYLVGRDGRVIVRFAPKTTPEDSTLVAAITAALAP